MKKTIKLIALAIVLLGLTNCTTIPAGSVGIVVHNFGNNKGVDNVSATTGFTWYNPMSTSIFKYPTNVQTAKWTKDPNEGNPSNEEITFTNKDNMTISVDVSISYSLVYDKVPYFYVKFRNDDISQFTHGFLRNVTRDAFNETGGSYSIDEIMGDNTKFLNEVRKKVQDNVSQIGVNIEQFGLIGAPRPPDAVIEAINLKLKATQTAIQKENELRQSIAQAKKDIAEAKGDSASMVIRAAGEAKANQLRQTSLTDNIIRSQMLEKWDGKLPVYGEVPNLFKTISK
jgi:regulator of protease activity HflC (stomatin/prohibitin superfamily)